MLVYRERFTYYVWNVLVTLCAVYMTIYLPLSLLFDLTSNGTLNLCYWTASIVFIVDFILNVKQYKANSTRDVSSQSWIISHGGWLIVDLVAAIPFGPVFGAGTIQLVRLIKLARVAQFFRHFRQAELRFSIGLTLFSFLFWTALLVHLLCYGWMVTFGIDPGSDDKTNYITSLYWTVTTLTAVGYGDIVPVTNVQRIYAMIVQITGIGVFGFLIGSVVNILSRMDSVKAKYSENVELLRTAVIRRGLPVDLQKRILDYYQYVRNEKMGYDESAFLESLPDTLKNDVALELKKEFIEQIPLFQQADDSFINDVALQLKYTVATPGDYIFKTGEKGDEMYFVIHGDLEVLNQEEDKILTVLKEGDFFGEIALFESRARTATVKTAQYCNLYKLERETFEEVIAKHPDIADQIRAKAISRFERHGNGDE